MKERCVVGVDVSKGKSTVAIITSEGEVIEETKEILHTEEEMKKVCDMVSGKEEVLIVMEATGNYHLPVLKYFREKGYEVCVENAYIVNKYKSSQSLRKTKTDKKDAMSLAEYGIEKWGKIKRYEEKEEKYEKLRNLSRHYSSVIGIQTKAKVNLVNLQDITFPKFASQFERSQTKVMLKLYEKYYHPEKVLSKRKTSFENDVIKIAKHLGSRRGQSIAEKIYNLAQSEIAILPVSEETELMVKNAVKTLRTELEISESIITKMHEIARELPEYKVVMSIKGVGEKIGPRLIGEIGDIRKYKNKKSLIASAGIDPSIYESGTYKGEGLHITKRGNKYIRRIGYEVMISLKRIKPKEDEVYKYIIQKEKEGKNKKVAKVAGMNKFLRVYYGKVREVYK